MKRTTRSSDPSESADDLQRMMREHQVRAVDLARRIGELRGRTIATFENLQNDPELVEGLRARAWIQWVPALRGRIGFNEHAQRFTGVPQGWPKGVDGKDYVSKALSAERASLLARIDGDGVAPEPTEEPSESVRALRQMLGG